MAKKRKLADLLSTVTAQKVQAKAKGKSMAHNTKYNANTKDDKRNTNSKAKTQPAKGQPYRKPPNHPNQHQNQNQNQPPKQKPASQTTGPKPVQQNQLPVIPFGRRDRLLLVGEGDFSYAASLLRQRLHRGGPGLVATVLEADEATLYAKYPGTAEANVRLLRRAGAGVVFGVDATKLVGGGGPGSAPSSAMSLVKKVKNALIVAAEDKKRRIESGETLSEEEEEEEEEDEDEEEDEEEEEDEDEAGMYDDDHLEHRPSKKNALAAVVHAVSIDTLDMPTTTTVSRRPRKSPQTVSRSQGPHPFSFDRIIFNFPHVGGKSKDVNRQVRYHQQLLSAFFTATLHEAPAGAGRAASQNHPTLLRPGGAVVVTIFEGEPYTLWNVRDVARSAGLQVERSFRFPAKEVYPDYHHARTLGVVRTKTDEARTEETKEKEDVTNDHNKTSDSPKETDQMETKATEHVEPAPKLGPWRGEDRPARSFVLIRKGDVLRGAGGSPKKRPREAFEKEESGQTNKRERYLESDSDDE